MNVVLKSSLKLLLINVKDLFKSFIREKNIFLKNKKAQENKRISKFVIRRNRVAERAKLKNDMEIEKNIYNDVIKAYGDIIKKLEYRIVNDVKTNYKTKRNQEKLRNIFNEITNLQTPTEYYNTNRQNFLDVYLNLFPEINIDDTRFETRQRRRQQGQTTKILKTRLLEELLSKNFMDIEVSKDNVSIDITFKEKQQDINTDKEYSLIDTLNLVFNNVYKIWNSNQFDMKNKNFKISFNAMIVFNTLQNEKQISTENYINLVNQTINTFNNNKDNVFERYNNMISQAYSRSDLTYLRFHKINVKFIETRQLTGSSYCQLPNLIKNKGGIINFKNKDHLCLLWSIACYKYKLTRGDDGICIEAKNDVKNWTKILTDNGINFPYQTKDVRKIGDLIGFHINLFIYVDRIIKFNLIQEEGCEWTDFYDYKYDNKYVVNILFYTNQEQNHYVWLKDIDCLFTKENADHNSKMCYRCHFPVNGDYINHINKCNITSDENTYTLVKESKSIVKYNRTFTSIRKSTVIYSDFECLIQTNNEHKEIYGFCLVVSDIQEINMQVREFYGENFVVEMLKYFDFIANTVNKYHRQYEYKIDMTEQQEMEFQNATKCYICNVDFTDKDIKVRDHDHDKVNANYRGASHRSCNLRYSRKCHNLSVIFHNFRGYDSHIIIKNLNTIQKEENTDNFEKKIIKIIAKSSEKIQSMSYGNVKYIDSMQHNNTSLDKWQKSEMISNNKFLLCHKFFTDLVCKLFNVETGFTIEDFKNLVKKQWYLYKYCEDTNDYQKPMPTLEQWREVYTEFKDSDYLFIQYVCKKLNIKNYFDYTRFYCMMDVFILADCFESLRNRYLNDDGIDCSHYISAPSVSNDCLHKKSNVNVKLLHCTDKHIKYLKIKEVMNSYHREISTIYQVRQNNDKIKKLMKQAEQETDLSKKVKLYWKLSKTTLEPKETMYNIVNRFGKVMNEYLLNERQSAALMNDIVFSQITKIMNMTKDDLNKEYDTTFKTVYNMTPIQLFGKFSFSKKFNSYCDKLMNDYNKSMEEIYEYINVDLDGNKLDKIWTNKMKMVFIKIITELSEKYWKDTESDKNIQLYKDFQQNWIRGGISQVCRKRYESAFEPDEKILYIDANNLYGFEMMKHKPYEMLEKITNKEEIENTKWFELANTNFDKLLNFMNTDMKDYNMIDFGDIGYVVKCKSINPPTDKVSQDRLIDMPLFPVNRCVNENELSNKQFELLKDINSFLGIQKDIKVDGNQRMICDFNEKTNYIVHYMYLAMASRLGYTFEVEYIHSFKQASWMREYIESNTNKRNLAKLNNDEAGRDFYKLKNNSVFGKQMENVLKYNGNSLLNSTNTVRYANRSSFKNMKKINDNLYFVNYSTSVELDKPIFVGASILDESKITMSIYWHFILKPKFGDNITLLYQDTDSYIFKIKDKNYKQKLDEISYIFDENTVGKMKIEYSDVNITEFIGLQAKAYALNFDKPHIEKGKEIENIKKLKGYDAKKLKFQNYKSCIENIIPVKVDEVENFISKNHTITTMTSTKISLSNMDYKNYICDDGVEQRPYGYLY